MAKNNWKDIWSNKTVNKKIETKITLAELIEANGFDTGFGSYNEENWRTLVADFCNRVALDKQNNVLEIGCGCGAFLYACNEIVNANYFGLDYSSSLVQIAKTEIPNGHFVVAEANELTFLEYNFDVILSHGVFFYFPSHQYVETVLQKYTERIVVGGSLVLMEMNDSAHQKEYHSMRKSLYKNPKDYEKDYEGLQHLFFDKDEIERCLRSLGMDKFEYFPHAVKSYGNGKFRFNLMCQKV